MAKSTGRRIIIDDPSDNVAIRVSDVSKSFRLPHNRQNSIKGSLVNLIGGGDRSYETQEVLKDISFEIKKGEFFGIVGRNGSGKSTLLKMLAGIYKPTAGSITVNGSLTPFIELGVGFNPELTGRENVYMNGALLGFNDKEVDAMYDDIMSFAELERFMDQKLKNYSSGMQVRLAFSIAIRARSDILLLDEVLAVGDANFQEKCEDVFRQIKKDKRTVIFVSHDEASLKKFCTKGILIKDGELLKDATIAEVLAQYNSDVQENQQTSSLNKPQDRRPGTGETRVKAVYLQDSKGNRCKNIRAGEDFSLEINVDSFQPLKASTSERVTVGISINDLDGVSIIGPNTQEANLKITLADLQKNPNITATFSTNVLSPGVYDFVVGLFYEETQKPIDFVTFPKQIKIIGVGRHGKTTIEPTWHLGKTAK